MMRLFFVSIFLMAGLAGLSACQSTGGSGLAFYNPQYSAVARSSQTTTNQASTKPKTVNVSGTLKADIYSPHPDRPKGLFALVSAKPKTQVPVIVYVHGGGWIKGERTKVYNLPSYAKSRGYMLVSVDYRPVPKTTIDGQVSDIVKSIRWVRNNIGKYGGDPSKIVIMGHSAGSHLVSLIAVKKLAGPVRGVVANDVQAYDLPEYYRLRNNSMARVYRQAFGTRQSDWVKYSPITYVDRNSGYPPFLILYSRSDYERRKALATGFARELRSRGTSVTLFDGRNYTHGSIARDISKSGSVTKAVDRFLSAAFI
ncbi:MAG: alpha/beta hydrolase [Pseudomonadota bacterium]